MNKLHSTAVSPSFKIGKKLIQIRRKKRISQSCLAADLKISQAKLSRIESGTAKIELELFIAIIHYFKLERESLLKELKLDGALGSEVV